MFCGHSLQKRLNEESTFLHLGNFSSDLVLVISALKHGMNVSDKYASSVDKAILQTDRIQRYLVDADSLMVRPPILREGEDKLANEYFLFNKTFNIGKIRNNLFRIKEKQTLVPDELDLLSKFYGTQLDFCSRKIDGFYLD